MIIFGFPAYNVHTISSAITLMSTSSTWTLPYHLVLFPPSQHFMFTSVSMLFVVRCACLYVTTTQPTEKTCSDGALVAHTARSSRTMGARAGYAMFPLQAHQCYYDSMIFPYLLLIPIQPLLHSHTCKVHR